jgi:hypothetical protein
MFPPKSIVISLSIIIPDPDTDFNNFTSAPVSASLTASANDLYYIDNSGGSDYYIQVNNDTYQSMNTITSYNVRGNDIYGSDGSYYRQDNKIIYDMQTGSTYCNNNGYIQEF